MSVDVKLNFIVINNITTRKERFCWNI